MEKKLTADKLSVITGMDRQTTSEMQPLWICSGKGYNVSDSRPKTGEKDR
jgi:hypothetical protein